MLNILLIHGNSGTAKDMKPFEQFFENSSITNNDLPCHGRNRQDTFNLTIENCAQMLHDQLISISDPIVIIGYSDGANIAMNLCHYADLNIKKVFLIAPTISWFGMVWWLRLVIKLSRLLLKRVPILKCIYNRMCMMTDYNYHGKKIEKIPTQIYFAEHDVVVQAEQEKIESLLQSEKIIIQGTNHFNLLNSKELQKSIASEIHTLNNL
jgi:pimeloyl-ACP methyl ester carboxylesterase